MSERDKERLYWKVSLFFLAASPLVIYQLVQAHFSLAFHPFPFTIIMFLSMPVLFLLDLGAEKLSNPSASLRFWVVKPVDEVQHLLRVPGEGNEESLRGLLEKTYLNQVADTILGRLAESKFSMGMEEQADGSKLIRFRKEKNPPVLSFMENSFFGEAHLSLAGASVSVNLRLTFNDTLILATGEFEQLRGLSNYLVLKSPQLICENVPMLIYCGLITAFATVIVGLVPALYRLGGNLFYTCLAAGAGSMILASLILMQKNRKQLFGYRLACAGICLAALPFISRLFESFRQ